MIGTHRSYEHRGVAIDRSHLMPVEVIRHSKISDWIAGAVCVAGIAVFIIIGGIFS